ncbi:tRNA (adenosine(37)-N6)-threonylcarbamoyltransferase complex ATPase subunit type 1 TsaE [Candidatus Parcubacteria bacterium]|nr:MAG: tRNA (adenosine(37)-N6)-threonylcarbamoyltransferase complex ATPase subunit type 1 TsaE [Candidatus Parcubacteria bacterium]
MTPFFTSSPRATAQLGADFARRLHRLPPALSLVVGVQGELGSGKTTFLRGLLRGLGVRGKVTSPTFTLVRKFSSPLLASHTVVHIDAYRLSPKEGTRAYFRELLDLPHALFLVEWPEHIARLLPRDRVRVRLSYGETPQVRKITIAIPPSLRRVLR